MSDFWDSARDRILRFGFWRMYGTGDGPHPDSADLYDEQAVAELGRGACVRSGNCCLAAPCPVAIGRGEQYGQSAPIHGELDGPWVQNEHGAPSKVVGLDWTPADGWVVMLIPAGEDLSDPDAVVGVTMAAYVDHYTPTPDEELTASLRRARDLGIIDDDQLSAAVAAIRSRHAR